MFVIYCILFSDEREKDRYRKKMTEEWKKQTYNKKKEGKKEKRRKQERRKI